MAESRRLSSLLVCAAERSKAVFAQAATELDLPVHLARALLALDDPEPMSELASSLECDRSYVTGLVDQLEERGLVSRVPGDDRRIKLLQLTPAGRRLRNRLAERVGERSLVMRQLTDKERAALGPLLERLVGDGGC